ncbi:MAG: RluA family pseudouridine synthase [Saccharofermentans sp.]|nr:RluA family pseudouridine synthase [Saccharofermentans sp.]
MEFNYVVTSEQDGRALKSVMASMGMSRNMIKRVKLYGDLDVNGEHVWVNHIVHEGDTIFARYPDDVGDLNKIPNIPILYEDKYFAVVCKPSGMVTHPTHGHLDDSLLTALNSSENPLHPVMRLDRETSGLMVVAKTGHIHKLFSEQHCISKQYMAAVYGKYEPTSGTINEAIKRRENSVMIRDVASPDDPDGKQSITHYNEIAYDSSLDISLIRFKLETGRCHQIRVHSTYMGHPLVGDGLYGPNSIDNPSELFPLSIELDKKCPRVALHAAYLQFTHPITNEVMSFTSLPSDEILNLSPEFRNQLTGELDRFFI